MDHGNGWACTNHATLILGVIGNQSIEHNVSITGTIFVLWLSEKLKPYLFCMIQNGIVYSAVRKKYICHVVKKRVVKDWYTLIGQSLYVYVEIS